MAPSGWFLPSLSSVSLITFLRCFLKQGVRAWAFDWACHVGLRAPAGVAGPVSGCWRGHGDGGTDFAPCGSAVTPAESSSAAETRARAEVAMVIADDGGAPDAGTLGGATAAGEEVGSVTGAGPALGGVALEIPEELALVPIGGGQLAPGGEDLFVWLHPMDPRKVLFVMDEAVEWATWADASRSNEEVWETLSKMVDMFTAGAELTSGALLTMAGDVLPRGQASAIVTRPFESRHTSRDCLSVFFLSQALMETSMEKSRFLRCAFQLQADGGADHRRLVDTEAEVSLLREELEASREALRCATQTAESLQKQSAEREALLQSRVTALMSQAAKLEVAMAAQETERATAVAARTEAEQGRQHLEVECQGLHDACAGGLLCARGPPLLSCCVD